METDTTGDTETEAVAQLNLPDRVSCRHGPAATPELLQFSSCELPGQSADKYSILVYRTTNHFLIELIYCIIHPL